MLVAIYFFPLRVGRREAESEENADILTNAAAEQEQGWVLQQLLPASGATYPGTFCYRKPRKNKVFASAMPTLFHVKTGFGNRETGTVIGRLLKGPGQEPPFALPSTRFVSRLPKIQEHN